MDSNYILIPADSVKLAVELTLTSTGAKPLLVDSLRLFFFLDLFQNRNAVYATYFAISSNFSLNPPQT